VELIGARGLAALMGDASGERAPRYVALADRVRLLVADGRVPLGARLPAERELAVALGLSRATVTAAYARLREDGWATARQGSGTFTALPAGPHRGAWVPAPVEDGVIDLAHAAPSAPPAVAAAFAAAVRELPRLLPGHGYHPAGLPELRERIARRYTVRGLPTTAEEVLVTAGAMHGVSLAFALLLQRGRRLMVEQPTYPNALDAARAAGARVVPTALEAEEPGAWLPTVHRTLAAVRPPVAYLMPDHQNPTGRLLDDDDRLRLARALRRAGTAAVVDETLAELTLDGRGRTPFGAFAEDVLSIGTLSKTHWGGLRVGWVRGPADTVRRLTVLTARSSLAGPVVEQLAACALLDDEEGVAVQRQRLRERRDVLAAELRERLPGWTFALPAGGLALWCRLPSPRSSALTVAAERLGVRLAPGPLFGTGHALEDRVRVPYTQPPDVLRRAVPLLARADAQMTDAAEQVAPGRRTDEPLPV
jgi:DNA-binding transcriptional MocR family regulator